MLRIDQLRTFRLVFQNLLATPSTLVKIHISVDERSQTKTDGNTVVHTVIIVKSGYNKAKHYTMV